MEIKDCVALVTGANRGIGEGFVHGLLERGARRIYASARNPAALAPLARLDPERVIPLELDLTDSSELASTSDLCRDLTLIVNNGGITAHTGFIGAPDLEGARAEMEVNYWGQLALIRALVPVLRSHGGGGIIQILSIGAMTVFPAVGSYCASKFAAHAMTKGVRAELAPFGTRVMGVFSGAIESDMSKNTPGPKISAVTHAHNCLAAFESGIDEFYPDFKAQAMREAFSRDAAAFDRARYSVAANSRSE